MGVYNVQCREETDETVVKCMLAKWIAFNITCSPFYKEMVRKIIAVGSGHIPHSDNKVRTILLDRRVSKMQQSMEHFK